MADNDFFLKKTEMLNKTTSFVESWKAFLWRLDMIYRYLISGKTNIKDNDVIFWEHSTLPFTLSCSIVYIITIFTLQKYMKNKEAFNLRPALVLWSAFLAVFSIRGAWITLPYYYTSFNRSGWNVLLCNGEFQEGALSIWSIMFGVSKIVEFGDTVFIILRKQRLIFLHWYHHATTLILCFYTTESRAFGSLARSFMTMNFFVHAVMYSYYTLKALKFPVPKIAAMCLTLLQVLQMVAGFWMSIYAFLVKAEGHYCDPSFSEILLSLGIYTSFFVLFSHFFYNSYYRKAKSQLKKDV